MIKNKIDIELMHCSQSALLCHVPACLRHVSVELINNKIHWHCVFDSSASEDDIELLSQASTELISNFNDYGLYENFEIINLPEKGDTLKNIVYWRNEHNYFEN